MKEQCRVACESNVGERTWKPAIAALRLVLERLNVGAGNATVVLSNRFVRYAVVPWQNQVSGGDVEVAFALPTLLPTDLRGRSLLLGCAGQSRRGPDIRAL